MIQFRVISYRVHVASQNAKALAKQGSITDICLLRFSEDGSTWAEYTSDSWIPRLSWWNISGQTAFRGRETCVLCKWQLKSRDSSCVKWYELDMCDYLEMRTNSAKENSGTTDYFWILRQGGQTLRLHVLRYLAVLCPFQGGFRRSTAVPILHHKKKMVYQVMKITLHVEEK